MEPKIILSIIAIVLTFAGYIPYVRNTLKGKTTPHAFTWFIWFITTGLAGALQLSAGGGIGAYVTLAVALFAVCIFILSLFKGETHITKSDLLFFVLALIALGFWLIAKQPIVSVLLLSLTNALAFAPTIRKTREKPFSETLFTYVLNATRQFLNLVVLEQYNFITALFPVSQVFMTVFFIVLILARRKNSRTPV